MNSVYERMRVHSTTLAPLVGALALLFVVLLTLSLSQSQSLAEPAAESAVDKQVNTSQAGPGDTLTYTIHITNDAEEATLWMTDSLPVEVGFNSGSLQQLGPGSAGYANGVVTWTAPNFGYGNWVYITFTVEISPDITSATVVNTAEVTGTGTLNTDSVSTEVSPGHLEILKAASPSPVRPGEQLVYMVYITNTGNGTVGSASMADNLPPEVDWTGVLSYSTGTAGVANDVVTWTGSVAPSEVVSVTFTVAVSSTLGETASFTNTVEVTGAGLPVSYSVETPVFTSYTVYFPIIFKRYPPIPTLYSIPTPGENNAYTVSWEEIDSPDIEHYVLQESTSSSFSTYTEWETTNTSRAFTKGPSIGTYYYRVRVDGSTWGEGPWSNVKSVTIGFYDDFNNPSSGWPDDKGFVYEDSSGGRHYWRRGYIDGEYRIYIDAGGPPMWFHQPDALASYRPQTDKYCVETEIKFVRTCWWCVGGLVIGAPEDNTKLYMLFLGYLGNGNFDWNLAMRETYNFPKMAGTGSNILADGTNHINSSGWNNLKASVNGNNVKAYVNGYLVTEKTMSGLSSVTRVGVFGGVYEITPGDFRFKYLKVIPNVECP